MYLKVTTWISSCWLRAELNFFQTSPLSTREALMTMQGWVRGCFFWLCFHSHRRQQNPINERGPSCKFLLLAAERDLHCIYTSVIWHQGNFPRLIWHREDLANSVFEAKKNRWAVFLWGINLSVLSRVSSRLLAHPQSQSWQPQEEGSTQHLSNMPLFNFWISGGSVCIWYQWGVMWFYATRLGRWAGKHFM